MEEKIAWMKQIEFNIIYIAPNWNNSCLKVFDILRLRPYNNIKETEKTPAIIWPPTVWASI